MEREKEIYDTQVNNLEAEEKTLAKLENDKRIVQDNLDKIRQAEEEIEQIGKICFKIGCLS